MFVYASTLCPLPLNTLSLLFPPSALPSLSSIADHPPVSPFYRPPVTSHLMFSNRAISITAPRFWNNLQPELRTISLPPSPSLPITRQHLHPAPLSITPWLSTQN